MFTRRAKNMALIVIFTLLSIEILPALSGGPIDG
jgi:hypothetical protein